MALLELERKDGSDCGADDAGAETTQSEEEMLE